MIVVVATWLLSTGCYKNETVTVSGKQPVYISYDALLSFSQEPPRAVENAGKVMVYDGFLFLGETNVGIHIIDISDTLNPHKIYFLNIPGNKDIVAQNHRLYADNGPHLLVLDITDIHNIGLVERKLNWFDPSEFYPADYTGPFQCADYSQGWLVSWQDAMLENPKCKR